MARDLKLQVVLDAVNNATRPLRQITRGSEATAQALKASRDQLKQLERAQRDLRAFRDMKRQAGETGDALAAQRRQVAELSRQLNTTEGDTASLNRERDRAIRKAQELARTYDRQSGQAQRLKRSLRDTHDITGRLAGSEQSLARQMRDANAQIDQQQRKLTRLAESQRRARQAADQYQRGIGRANNMRGAGMTGLATGGAALYGGARLLAPGVAYGEQMSAVQAVGRFTEDDQRFQALQAQSRELGASTAFSATEVGAGQEFLLRAGMSAEAIRASMGDVLDLAIANNTELGRTADIASNIAGTFKIDLEQDGAMTRVADVLSATASRANVDLEKLGNTVKYLGGAADLNISLEQATAMAGILGNIGIQGEMAGTAMRAMKNRLTNPTKAAAGVMQDLGLQVADTQGNMRDLPAILSDIEQATAGLGNVERTSALQEIFGVEAGSGMSELVDAMGEGRLTELIEAVRHAQGENAGMARTMADNIGGDLKALNSAWQEIGITLTDTNQGPLRELIQKVTAVTRAVGDWMKENPELTAQIATAAAGVAGLVAVGGALTLMLASLLGPIVTVRYGLAMLGIQTGGLGGRIYAFTSRILPALGKGLLWVGRIMATVGRALLLNPIGLAITAIAGAAYLIYRHWDGIAAFFRNRWADVKAAFQEGAGAVVTLLLNWNPIGLIYRSITKGLGWLGVDVPQRFATLGGLIVDGLFGALSRGLAAGWQHITGAFDEGLAGLGRLLLDWSPFGLLWRGITAALERLGVQVPQRFASLGSAIVDSLIGGVTGALGALRERIVGMAGSVADWFKGVLGIHSPSRVFAGFGGNLIEGLVNGIDERWQALKDAIGGTADAVVGWFKEKLGIHSPSRVFAELGGHTMAGLQRGLKAGEDGPLHQVDRFGQRLRQAGAGLSLGALTLPSVATATPPVPPELPALRVTAEAPALPELGTLRAPGLELPPVPELPTMRLAAEAPALPELGSLRAPGLELPPVPELPAMRVTAEAPALPKLGTLHAPRLELPPMPELPAMRVAVEAPALPELGTLRAPGIELPSMPELPALRVAAEAPPLPELGILHAPRLELPPMPELPAMRVAAEAPALPELGTLRAPGIELPPMPELPAMRLTTEAPTLSELGTLRAPGLELPPVPELPAMRVAAEAPAPPDLGILRAPGIELPPMPELPTLKIRAESPRLPQLGELPSLRLRPPQLDTMPALAIQRPEVPDLGTVPYQRPELPALQVARPDVAPIAADTQPIQIDNRPPLTQGGMSPSAGSLSFGDININVNAAPGMDEQTLAQHVAREVQRALEDAQRDASARGRSSLWDRE
ncbi:phage tail tape measure protein [Halomonas organivorans]|uniref:TP901 family phage tail tape measure protein n=1 Tax=Halomonas organivorans TaxID=257772 RepID=A0A7W5BY38_9GAMM|nr:phage tail tape measure protein [Halomonas organivorans]MBB3141225.1 TP901 family phage tail tape measure protein [Halomonas organivorans]